MKTISTALLLSLAAAGPALAHLDPIAHGSFAAGISHPLFGADHILAMIGVGLWAFLIGGRAVWAVPAAFVGTMMLGFGAALAGIPLPAVEPVVAASVVVLGLLALLALPVPTAAGMAIVGVFALFHGHAHGGELGAASGLSFMAGFGIATVLLHGAGLMIGLVAQAFLQRGRLAARAAGGLTALAGLSLLAGA